jgi:hypothetical protein
VRERERERVSLAGGGGAVVKRSQPRSRKSRGSQGRG